MTLEEARQECRRYLDYLQFQRDKSYALQKLASDRRAGRVTLGDAHKRMREINGPSPTVYDGSDLEKAVKVLLEATKCGT